MAILLKTQKFVGASWESTIYIFTFELFFHFVADCKKYTYPKVVNIKVLDNPCQVLL